jgi:arylsulfatase A-like enzyme
VAGKQVPTGDRQRNPKLVTVGRVRLPSFSAHPPSESTFNVEIRPGTRLRLHVALLPEVWDKACDGVTFEARVDTEYGEVKVLSFHLDPAANPDHRRWYPLQVDLDRFQGADRRLILRTLPGPAGDPNYDWALWGDPTLETTGRIIPLAEDAKTHVIFISLDTLRKDHLDLFGHHRLTAPHLNASLDEFIIFNEATSPSHWTMPSHMSVFTSVHPEVHQVADPRGQAVLPAGIPTLTELLKNHGYRTGGFAACDFLSGRIGFDRGFDMYTLNTNDAARQNELTVEWLRSNRRHKTFVFLHYFDVHSDFDVQPYGSFSGFDRLYPENASSDSFSGCSPDGTLCASRYLLHLNRTGARLSGEELASIEVQYDRGIRYLDYQLALLVARLKTMGFWDSSLVIIFSDHGEEFQDHGMLLHAQLYQELLEVPLLIKLPGGLHGGVAVDEPVDLVDIAPTVLSILGKPVPDTMQGRSFLPAIARVVEAEGWHEALGGDAMSFTSWSAEGRSSRQGRWKLLTWRHPGSQETLKYLFNLDDDPAERIDLSDSHPEVVRWLNAREQEWVARQHRWRQRLAPPEPPAEGPEGFSDNERQRLIDLGYLE